MERNADDTFGTTGAQDTNTGTGGFGTTGAGAPGSTAPGGGVDYSTGTAGTTGTAAETRKADQAKAKVQDQLGKAKEKARELQSTLADRLDAGADKLRQRSQSATLAGAAGEAGTVGVATDDRMAKVEDSLARGMNKSADWLRNGDLRADIEKQVRENPGRTLLVALGVGYLLGKAFRSNR